MTIESFYQKKLIPKNLQRHMLRVAAVGKYIVDHWNGQVDSESVVKTLLLHDLGNLLKFDLSKGLHFFDADERDASYWTEVQLKQKQEYSQNEHHATLLMAKELNVDKRVIFLLEHMGSSNFHKTLSTNDWELKICSYSDFRVGPNSFLSVEDRFNDILQRYKGRDHVFGDRDKTLEKMRYCLKLETQLSTHFSTDIKVLPVDDLEKSIQKLRMTVM